MESTSRGAAGQMLGSSADLGAQSPGQLLQGEPREAQVVVHGTLASGQMPHTPAPPAGLMVNAHATQHRKPGKTANTPVLSEQDGTCAKARVKAEVRGSDHVESSDCQKFLSKTKSQRRTGRTPGTKASLCREAHRAGVLHSREQRC